MVDLKFFDIPETVSHAVRQLKDRGISFATVHGNDPIIEGAVKEKDGLKILAVTALTCFGEEDMIEMFGQPVDIEELVLSRARRALRIGADGVVSSGLEAKRLRDDLGERFLIVTPGIRPGKNREIPMDDQKRNHHGRRAVANGPTMWCGPTHPHIPRPRGRGEANAGRDPASFGDSEMTLRGAALRPTPWHTKVASLPFRLPGCP